MNHYTPAPGRPVATRDSRPNNPEQQQAIDNLLRTWRDIVGNKVRGLLQRYEPGVWERVKLLGEIVEEELAQEVHHRPAFRLGKACQAVSVKRGVSGEVHIDATDDIDTFAIVTPVGAGWKYGDLGLGQLGLQVPVKPGTFSGNSYIKA